MAVTLQISDGSVTVNLNDNSTAYVRTSGYVPREPEVGEVEVEETAEAIFLGTVSTARGNKNSLTRLFEQAKRYQDKKVGPRVYVQFKPESGDDTYRAEILSGRCELEEGTLNVNVGLYGAGRIGARITWRRRYYWEGPETQVPLTNGNGTDDTSGLTIYNHDDAHAGHDNYVQIAADDVDGDLPSPARIELTNSYNDSDEDSHVWIGHNVLSDPANFDHILEAEDATGASATANATCSGGEYVATTLSTDSETTMLTWALSSSFLTDCNGAHFRVLARFREDATTAANITDVKFRLKLQVDNRTIWQGEQVRPKVGDSYVIRDLGIIRLPPWPIESGQSSVAMNLLLTGQRTSGVNETIDLDFLMLVPTDGFRLLERVGDGVAYNERLVDDGISETVYVDTGASTARRSNVVAVGKPVMLWPNTLQRLYFLIHTWTANNAEIVRTHTVKVYYRPRRASL